MNKFLWDIHWTQNSGTKSVQDMMDYVTQKCQEAVSSRSVPIYDSKAIYHLPKSQVCFDIANRHVIMSRFPQINLRKKDSLYTTFFLKYVNIPGQVKDQLLAPWGVSVWEVAAGGEDANVTLAQLSHVVHKARRVRQVSWCVTVVVVSDDLAFLAAFAQWSLKGRLLVWSTRLLVVTRLPLPELQDLHRLLSSRNAMVVLVDYTRTILKCSMYIQLPYTPRDSRPVWVASWTPQLGLAVSSTLQLFPEKFYRFMEAPNLLVSVIPMPYHNALLTLDQTDPERRRFIHTGPIAMVVEYLAKALNFTYTNVIPRDNTFGIKADDGSWTGMLGMVQRREADIAIGPFGLSLTRAEAVDFSWPLWYESSRILAGRGRPEIDPWGFVQPLAPLVWVGILAAMLAVPLVEFLFSWLLSVRNSAWSNWLLNTLDFAFVLLQQDPYLPMKWWWERVVMLVWMMVTLVLTQSYAGNLMALLAVRHIPQPYQSLQDVLDDPSAVVITQSNTINTEYFRVVKSGLLYEVANLVTKNRLIFKSQVEYPELVGSLLKSGRHVLFDVSHLLRNLMAKDYSRTGECNFYTSSETYLHFAACIISQKDNSVIPALQKRMLALTEFGVFERWFKTAFPNSTVCLHPLQKYTVLSYIAITNLWGIFVALMAGGAVSLLVFCVEVLNARVLSHRISVYCHDVVK
ncbi:probable glutamate receptor [Procambarus clarkii]|uniref:probable glutamate receptor n=1 Tax=Procambarus clarkii TaxID=6728 RepID=UPI003743E561